MTDVDRYLAAAHAMQSGVAQELTLDSDSGTPKHLRTGVNIAHSDHAALAMLLISKGIFTLAEYEKAIADQMEQEKAHYEELLSQKMKAKITLA